jgi:hypothetical protein
MLAPLSLKYYHRHASNTLHCAALSADDAFDLPICGMSDIGWMTGVGHKADMPGWRSDVAWRPIRASAQRCMPAFTASVSMRQLLRSFGPVMNPVLTVHN